MEQVLVNGTHYEFSSARLDVYGLKRAGFTSVDFNDKIDRGEGRGASQVALSSGKGKYTTDPLKITFHRSSGEELRQWIAGLSRTGTSIGNVKGTIVLQFIDDELGVQTITFKDCKVNVDGTGSAKEGSDPLTEDWEFYVRLIDRNGITLYESDEAGV